MNVDLAYPRPPKFLHTVTGHMYLHVWAIVLWMLGLLDVVSFCSLVVKLLSCFFPFSSMVGIGDLTILLLSPLEVGFLGVDVYASVLFIFLGGFIANSICVVKVNSSQRLAI